MADGPFGYGRKDQKKAYLQLNAILEKNTLKLKKFSNNIKFYLIHSLPNLSISVFDNIENLANENKAKLNNLTSMVESLRDSIIRLENEVSQLKKERDKGHKNKNCI